MSAAGWIAAGAGLGAIAGSFLAAFALRWPVGRPILWGRSACDGCARVLGPLELVPLASGLVLRGRCRTCRAMIDPTHPLLEGGCALLGALALWLQPNGAGLAGALLLWLLAALALIDARHFRLPDALTLPLAGFGLIAGAAGVAPSLIDRAVGLAAGWASLAAVAALYARSRGRAGLGAGDAKLMGAIGAWLGWVALPWVLLGASLGGLAFVGLRAATGARMSASDRIAFGVWLAGAAGALWLGEAAGLLAPP